MSTDFCYSVIQKAEFVFATFIKNVFNKMSIIGTFELIQYHRAKYRDITMYRFFSPTPRNLNSKKEAKKVMAWIKIHQY